MVYKPTFTSLGGPILCFLRRFLVRFDRLVECYVDKIGGLLVICKGYSVGLPSTALLLEIVV